jgi:precorrin-6B methylase 2
MADLYSTLKNHATNRGERLATAEHLVGSMRSSKTNAANIAYYNICRNVIRDLGASEDPSERRRGGELSTVGTAALLRSVPRVSGFLRAIERARQADTVLDAGTGSSALLAISSAVLHPKAEVCAYEINPRAAACAREMVRLFGLENRIEVRAADILRDKLPEVDLAVTETFGAALMGENGPKITQRLGGVAAQLLPAKVFLRASDSESGYEEWSTAAELNMREDNRRVAGSFRSTTIASGRLVPIKVHASYYDEQGEGIITARNNDILTSPVVVGEIQIPRPNMVIDFAYDTGDTGTDSYREVQIRP